MEARKKIKDALTLSLSLASNERAKFRTDAQNERELIEIEKAQIVRNTLWLRV